MPFTSKLVFFIYGAEGAMPYGENLYNLTILAAALA
jgi:hypothetical protein